MTLLVFLASSGAAALGTRWAALGFAGAAGLAASGSTQVVATTWSAAMAAALVLLGGPPRRLAPAAAGAGAVLAASTSSNAGVVLIAWAVGTTAAVLSEQTLGLAGRRRALALVATDALVAVGVCYGALSGGFVEWTVDLDTPTRAILLTAAVARVPLIGSMGRPAGLLVVRTQVLALIGFAVGGSQAMLELATVVGVVLFALAATTRSGIARDAGQETGLVLAAAATSALGWIPAGWAWGAAAGGTLTYSLRLRSTTGSVVPELLGGGGFGLPMLPAVMALVVGAARVRGGVAAVVAIGLAVGLGARAFFGTRKSRDIEGRLEGWIPTAVMLGAVAAGLWPVLLTVPRPPAAAPVPWPPLWAVALIVVSGLVGSRISALAPARRKRHPHFHGWADVGGRLGAPLSLARRRWGVTGPLVGLGLVAGGLWVAGLVRGFL